MCSRRIALCADDFGLNEAACKSIVELADMGAISSTSCLVDGCWGARYSRELKDTRDFAIGLHLNLVEGEAPYRRESVSRWIMRSYAFGIRDLSALRAEIARQLESFEQLFGRAPAFVDGHLHTHQLPVIRDLLLEDLEARYGRGIAVRSTVPRRYRGLKAAVINCLGGNAFTQTASARGFAINRDFGGVYNFTQRVPFARRMAEWLASASDLGLIMCHPQVPPAACGLWAARVAEHEFLASSQWNAMRGRMHVALVPFTCANFAVGE